MRRTMMAAIGLAALTLGACRSVAIPAERHWRLALPPLASAAAGTGVLRVADLQLATGVDSECLAIARGVRVEPSALDRWAAPLDRLVTDALVLGLSRSRSCELVKGAADPGDETWSLRGRIVEFDATGDAPDAEARVTLDLWLEQRGALCFHDEFHATTPLGGAGATAIVDALSRGLQHVVGDVVARMQRAQLFDAAAPSPSRGR